MEKDSETFAIRAAQRGDQQAWRELFEQHFGAVYQFCLGLAGGRNESADELTQEVFVTAARRIERFDLSRATFRAWLFGIAKNRFMTIKSSEQRLRRHEESYYVDSCEKVGRKVVDLRVHEALARLPSHYRVVLDAKYLQGLSMNEIAANKGASVEAVESLLRRARAGFAREYQQLQDRDS